MGRILVKANAGRRFSGPGPTAWWAGAEGHPWRSDWLVLLTSPISTGYFRLNIDITKQITVVNKAI